MANKVIFITTLGPSTFSVPQDFGYLVSVEAIGGGGGGGISAANLGTGGGGGAYAKSTIITGLTPGGIAYCNVGSGGVSFGSSSGQPGGNTWFNVASNSSPTLNTTGVLAFAGSAGGGSGGAGGSSTSSVGTIKFAGGAGGNAGGARGTHGGGGGAAGPGGIGGKGGNGNTSTTQGSSMSGGGGGGAGLTGPGANGAIGGTTQGGAGGNNGDNTGTPGTGGFIGVAATAGSGGAGGGGAYVDSTGNSPFPGGAGGAGNIWTASNGATAGPGGGLGGAGGQNIVAQSGGLYGGGGSGPNTGSGGYGAQGILVFIYVGANNFLSNTTTTNVGNTVNFTFAANTSSDTILYANGTTLYWRTLGTASNPYYFADSQNTGSFTITSNTGSFTRSISSTASIPNSSYNYYIQLATDSGFTNLIANSPTINVTSQTVIYPGTIQGTLKHRLSNTGTLQTVTSFNETILNTSKFASNTIIGRLDEVTKPGSKMRLSNTNQIFVNGQFDEYTLTYGPYWNKVSPGIIYQTNLIINLDPGNSASYSGSGTTWTNIAANASGNNFTWIATPTYVSSYPGYFNLNGTSQAAYNPYAFNNINANPNGYTFCGWFQTSATNGHKIIGMESANTGTTSANYDKHVYVGTDGKLYSGIINTAALKYAGPSATTVNDNKWHYFALVVGTGSTANTSLYLDGNYVGSALFTPNEAGEIYIRIGSYKLNLWTAGADGYFTGNIGAVQIYNTLLTGPQVQQNFTAYRSVYGV